MKGVSVNIFFKARAEREATKRSTEAVAKAATPATTARTAATPPARPAAVAADGSDDDEAPRMVRRPGGAARPVVAAKPTAKPGPA